MKTVTVEPLAEKPEHLLMTWQSHVEIDDMREAFRAITKALDESGKPRYVVVDIRANPRFPVTQTVTEAMEPYSHPNMAGWLIVGQNFLARSIERVLSAITRKHNVHWFTTLEDAIAYIKTYEQV